MHLLDLPTELLLHISRRLDNTVYVKCFRLACRAGCQAVSMAELRELRKRVRVWVTTTDKLMTGDVIVPLSTVIIPTRRKIAWIDSTTAMTPMDRVVHVRAIAHTRLPVKRYLYLVETLTTQQLFWEGHRVGVVNPHNTGYPQMVV